MQPENQITEINIELLKPNPYQPRKLFKEETLQELASSIKEFGILNPILVRKNDNFYEIIAGERRFRAAKLIGLKSVPVIIKDVDNSKLAEIALIENLQRENISPIEEAKSYQEILKLSNIKEQELSDIIGKSQPYISNKIRLLKLPSNIQEALANKKISERHARTLLSVNDYEKQTELLNRIIKEKLTIKELEKIINENEITEEDIKIAIDDIMKSLNIPPEENNKKEIEKESDNMNNGSFFPNAQPQMPDGNMTLNSLNMQPLNQSPVSENPTPQFAYNQSIGVQEQPNVVPGPSTVANFATPIGEPAPMPAYEVPPIQPTAPVEMNVQPMQSDVAPQPTMVDPPLFDQNIQFAPSIDIPAVPIPSSTEPTYDIPVTTDTKTVDSAPINKLNELEKYLTDNSINYKKYSNETQSCLIIEL